MVLTATLAGPLSIQLSWNFVWFAFPIQMLRANILVSDILGLQMYDNHREAPLEFSSSYPSVVAFDSTVMWVINWVCPLYCFLNLLWGKLIPLLMRGMLPENMGKLCYLLPEDSRHYR